MALPLYVQGCSRARFIKRKLIRTEQEAIRTHQEPTRNRLQPRKNQPGSAYSFQRMIFLIFVYASRSIVFAYLTEIQIGVQIGILNSSITSNTRILIDSGQFVCDFGCS